MSHFKFSAVFLASLFAVAQVSAQAQPANPGASAATNAAIGGVSQGVVFAAVVGVAMVAAVNSGSSGAVFKAAPAEFGEYLDLAAVVNTRVVEANKAVSDALAELEKLTVASPSAGVTTALTAAKAALAKSQASQADANQAFQDLQKGNSVGVAAVMSGDRQICAAALTCTPAELQALNENYAKAVTIADKDAVDVYNKSVALQRALTDSGVTIPDSVSVILSNSQAAVLALNTVVTQAVTKSNEIAAEIGSPTLPPSTPGTVAAPGTTTGSTPSTGT